MSYASMFSVQMFYTRIKKLLDDVESESNVSFPCQLHIRDRLWIDVNIAVGMTHLRITSVCLL